MAPTILIAGATGNTGRSVVETLSNLRETSSVLSGHRIVALTRSADGPVAQSFTKLPGVEVIEKNWIEISAEWLRKNEVVRAFVASTPEPSQFTDETMFHIAALEAGVKYVVRISTTAPNVRPDCKAFYPRSHWAIETLLATPEFERLQWTSLQPNAFTQLYLGSAVALIKQYRSTGKQDTLRIIGSADAPVGIIDPYDIGVLAALLLAQQDPTPHNKAKYVLNGPEDISGSQIIKLVEQYIGVKVENVVFEDMSFVDSWAENSPGPKNIILSVKHGLEPLLKGLCSASTTSKEVLELAAPKRTPTEVLKSMLE
ncbi:NAD(P)-binding protein [Xylaria castorea]|nr:NAD(P)-binding protein [Xylaria castorea]